MSGEEIAFCLLSLLTEMYLLLDSFDWYKKWVKYCNIKRNTVIHK